MPIPWLAVLKIVPWTDVITNAPKVVDGAKNLWNSVSRKPVTRAPRAESADLTPTPAPVSEPGPDLHAEAIAQLQARLAATEAAAAELHQEMLASSELIRSLADQNAQLIGHIEDHRNRIKWLTLAMIVLGVVAVLGLGLALAR
jgi:hypothetical protein